LLAVEVKQPMPGADTLADTLADSKPKVLGHAFDHAMAIDAFGQGTAIVIITSFKESYLCSLIRRISKKKKKRMSRIAQNEAMETKYPNPLRALTS
jgi:hypothetical protein